MNPRLTHIALHVVEFDACLFFYQNFCQMKIIHQRQSDNKRIAWLSEKGRETDFVFVLMSGGTGRAQVEKDYGHLGFAMDSKKAIDNIAIKAKKENCLIWEPRQEPYPVGYYCGLKDPDGAFVEFSYGQPLGPGAEQVSFERSRVSK